MVVLEDLTFPQNLIEKRDQQSAGGKVPLAHQVIVGIKRVALELLT